MRRLGGIGWVEEALDELFTALSSEARRRVLEALSSRGPCSFTELLRSLGGLDNATLAYHLSRMQGLIVKGDDGLHRLTPLGREAVKVYREARLRARALIPRLHEVAPIMVVEPSLRPYLAVMAASLAMMVLLA